MLRLVRLVRVFRSASVLRDFFSLEGLGWAAIATTFVVVAGGAAFSAVEKGQNLTVWDGLYWAITTVTTIGSDIDPDTTGGRIIAVVVLLTGIGFIAMLTGAVAQQFLGTLGAERQADIGALDARLERIERALERN